MLEKIIEYLQPYWFKLFITGVIIGAIIAYTQDIKG